MTQIFKDLEKLKWEHVAIFVLLIALVYFIMKHNGVKGAYHALVSDVHKLDEEVNPGVKAIKGKHQGCAARSSVSRVFESIFTGCR